MAITKQISDAFIAESKKKITKFFKNPCFACGNHYIEVDDREYSCDSWSVCEKCDEYRAIEKHSRRKAFPMLEALTVCIKKGFYKEGASQEFDIFDRTGYNIWGELDSIDFDAPSISGGLANFYRKQSQYRHFKGVVR